MIVWLNFVNTWSSFLLHFKFIAAVDLEEEGSEDDEDANDGHWSHAVLVNDAGYDDWDDLSAGHDDGEDNWTKSDDSVIDEELTNSRTDAQDNTIKHESWILRHELQRSVENTLLK